MAVLPTLRQLVRDSTTVLVLTLATFAADFALNIGLARSMDPANYGDYAVGLVALTVGMNVAMLGAEQSITRFLPEYLRKGEIAAAVGYVKFYAPLALGLALVLALLTELVQQSGAVAWALGFHQEVPHPYLVALWVVPLFALARFTSRMLRGFMLYTMAIGPLQIGVPLLVLLAVLAAHRLGIAVTEARVFAALAVAYLLALAVHWFATPLHFRAEMGRPGDYRIRTWMALSVPMMLVGLLTSAMHQVDVTMLELLHTDEDAVGHYAAASKVGHMLVLPLTSALIFLPPLLGRLAGTAGETEARRRLYLWSSLVLLLANGAMTLPVLLAPGWVLDLFGSRYEDAVTPLVLLALAGFVSGTFGLAVPFMQFAGQQRLVLWLAALAVGGNVLANAVLIPRFGTAGAAATSLATYAFYSLAVTGFAVYRLELLPWRRRPAAG